MTMINICKNILHAGRSCCDELTIVNRTEWGARNTSLSPTPTPVSYFFIHHTDTQECSDLETCTRRVQGIQNYHMDIRRNLF